LIFEPGGAASIEPHIVRAAKANNSISTEQYNAVSSELNSYQSVGRCSHVSQRASTKNELEMAIRTAQPSQKMLMQELMNRLLSQKDINLQDLIRQGEQAGIYFLFNQASTGSVTGITYFHNGF
jgi:hypothetical protein